MNMKLQPYLCCSLSDSPAGSGFRVISSLGFVSEALAAAARRPDLEQKLKELKAEPPSGFLG